MTDESIFKLQFYLLCTPNFCTKATMNVGARGSNFKTHCHDEIEGLNCMYTADNSMYFVRSAAERM